MKNQNKLGKGTQGKQTIEGAKGTFFKKTNIFRE